MKYVPPFGVDGSVSPFEPYVNGNYATGQEGSIPPADAFNEPLMELHNLIAYGGYTPDDAQLDQVTRAVRRQFYNFAVDTGSVNALSISLLPSPMNYQQGTPIRVLVANDNTGPCTLNNSGLGIRAIKRTDGSDLVAGDLKAGGIATIVDDGSHYQLQNQVAASTGGSTTITTKIPYCADSSVTPNVVTAIFTPAITALVEGDLLLVKMNNINSASVMMTTNALPAYPVYRNDGMPLIARDLLKNMAVLLEFHGTYYQVIGLVQSQARLTADLILYVRTDGNDATADGSINDAAHAFQTIGACMAYIQASFAIAGRQVTIQLGIAGTYTAAPVININSGTLVIRGDPANVDSYIINGISTSGGGCINAQRSNLSVAGVTLNMPGDFGWPWVSAYFGSQISLTTVAFKGFQQTLRVAPQIDCFKTCEVTLFGTIKTQVNATSFALANGGSITVGNWSCLIQNLGGPAYSQAFALAAYSGYVVFTYGYASFAGAASGYRYAAAYNSTINTFGGGDTFLPGSLPGYANTSSYYL